MTPSQPFRVLIYLAAVALAVPLVSCISSKPQSFRLSFLPTTPLPAEPISEHAPAIPPADALHERAELPAEGKGGDRLHCSPTAARRERYSLKLHPLLLN